MYGGGRPERPDRPERPTGGSNLPPKSASRSRERIDAYRYQSDQQPPPPPPPPIPTSSSYASGIGGGGDRSGTGTPRDRGDRSYRGGNGGSSIGAPDHMVPVSPGIHSRARSGSSAAAAYDARAAMTRAETAASAAPLHRDVEDVLTEVRISWPFMQQEDFQEVQLALQLLDGPGGRSVRAFHDMLARLGPAINTVVADYHGSFAFAVQHFSETLDGLDGLQRQIADMKAKLVQSREHLQLKQFDLLGLWNKGLVFREMLRILDLVDEIQHAPAEIEALMLSKYYLSAVKLLNRVLTIANEKECTRIGALDEARRQLLALKETLFEAIVNDINAHVYLKSPFCEDRWTAFVQGADPAELARNRASTIAASGGVPGSLARHPSSGAAAGSAAGTATRGGGGLAVAVGGAGGVRRRPSLNPGLTPMSPMPGGGHHLRSTSGAGGTAYGGGPDLATDPSHEDGDDGDDLGLASENPDENPEIDSLGFITLCLEAATRLGMLVPALEAVRERMHKETFAVVDHAINDARDAYVAAQFSVPAAASMASGTANGGWGSSSANGSGGGITDRHLLRDVRSKDAQFSALRGLCATLFAKLECVVEGHKLICNLVDAISRRPTFATKFGNGADLTDNPVYTVEQVANEVHEELRSVLMDYLRPKARSSDVFVGDLLRPIPPIKSVTPATKPDGSLVFPAPSVFKFGQSSSGSSVAKFYAAQLPSSTAAASAASATAGSGAGNAALLAESHVVDRYATAKALSHTPLFDADLEFICVVYRPTCDFLARLGTVAGTRAPYVEFLDEHILATYIPSIEAKVQSHVNKYINGSDGFVVGSENILQSASCLMSLIQSMCATMWQVPFRSGEYLRMIEDILSRYVERCYAKYRSVVTIGSVSTSGDGSDRPASRLDDGGSGMDGGAQYDGQAAAGETVSGLWARNPDLLHVVCQNTHFRGEPLNHEMNERFNVQEILMQARLCNDRSFQRSEIVFEKKKLELLAYLRVSLKWFRAEIIKLMETDVEDALMANPGSSSNTSGANGGAHGGGAGHGSGGESVTGSAMDLVGSAPDVSATVARMTSHNGGRAGRQRTVGDHDTDDDDDDDDESGTKTKMLTVPAARAMRFRELLEAYQALADSCLVTLHLEVRVHAMYHVDLAMREGTYFVEGSNTVLGGGGGNSSGGVSVTDSVDTDPVEPEPYILQLNADLGTMEELARRILPLNDAMFFFDGVGLLLTHYLVANVRYLRRLNRAGVRKMVTSVRALHQHLLHADLCREVRLDHARKYYELYLAGPVRMLDDIADHGAVYTLEEYRNMLDFMCDLPTLQDRLGNEAKSVAMAAAKTQRDHRDWCRRLEDLMKGG
ncbi:Sec8 exocyst complex component-specific domain-containing protein [Blastocladiella britannica]|nr:Sec8 exocyst complex component-specific domain-containing protein [Blastocladiella britannica]